MNIIVSFSGRIDGNCDTIAKYIASKDDYLLLDENDVKVKLNRFIGRY